MGGERGELCPPSLPYFQYIKVAARCERQAATLSSRSLFCTDLFLISMTVKAEQINVKVAVLLTTNPHNKKLCYFPYHLFLFLSCVENGGNRRKQNVAEITDADS